MTTPRKPRFFYGYVIVAACFFMMLVFWGTFNSFGVFFDSLLKEFGWSRAVTSGAVAANGILFSIFGILIARWSDRYGPQLIIGLCGVALGLGYFLMSLVSNVWLFYFYYAVVVAIGMGAYIAVLPIVTRWFVKRRALMTAVIFCGMGVGTMIVPPMVSRLILSHSWQFSYVIVGIIALVGIAGGAQFLRRNPRQLGQLPYGGSENESTDPALATGVSFQEALRTRQFWLVSIMYFIFLLSQLVIVVHIVVYAAEGLAVPEVSAAAIFYFIGFSLIVGMLLMGIVADRFSTKLAFTVSFAVLVISFLWLILVAGELWMLYVFGVLAGFSWGGMQVLYAPITAELFGLKSHGVILATAAFIGSIGVAVGPVMAGYIYDVTESYSWAFIIGAVLAAIGLGTAIFLTPLRLRGEK